MVTIFPRGYFGNTSTRTAKVTNALTKARSFDPKRETSYSSTVFLSHKHSDLKDIEGIIGVLENVGAKIYIDSIDNKMPGQTSGETALRIKEIIKFCKKFVLVATESAIESYWCNWELGIGDTYKYIDHIAIIPIKETGEYDFQYKGNEYLQIYPSIDYYDGTETYRGSGKNVARGYYVCKPRNKEGVRYIESLKDWINS